MENKSPILLIMVALVALMFGYMVGSHGKDPLMKNLQSTQTETASMIKDLSAKIDGMSTSGLAGGDAALQLKIAALEAKLATMENALGQMKGQQAEQQGPPPEDFNKVHNLPIGSSPVIGNKDAPVKITVFTDFQCPFCSRFHEPLKEVLKEYSDKVAIVIKHFPLGFHPNARPAAKAALAAAEQGKYEEMVNALYANQQQLSDEKYKEIAGQIGLNVDKFWSDYKDKDAQWEKQIQEDISLGEQSDVRGTPTFYINGRKAKARDIESWKQEINNILQ